MKKIVFWSGVSVACYIGVMEALYWFIVRKLGQS
jgi:hypothetical protein